MKGLTIIVSFFLLFANTVGGACLVENWFQQDTCEISCQKGMDMDHPQEDAPEDGCQDFCSLCMAQILVTQADLPTLHQVQMHFSNSLPEASQTWEHRNNFSIWHPPQA